jgi:hypothetical protein
MDESLQLQIVEIHMLVKTMLQKLLLIPGSKNIHMPKFWQV